MTCDLFLFALFFASSHSYKAYMLYTASIEKKSSYGKMSSQWENLLKVALFLYQCHASNLVASPCVTEGHILFFILGLWVENIWML